MILLCFFVCNGFMSIMRTNKADWSSIFRSSVFSQPHYGSNYDDDDDNDDGVCIQLTLVILDNDSPPVYSDPRFIFVVVNDPDFDRCDVRSNSANYYYILCYISQWYPSYNNSVCIL